MAQIPGAVRDKDGYVDVRTVVPKSSDTSPTLSRGRPVQVRLQRITCAVSKVHPPRGDNRQWWKRLQRALGTTSSDFVNAALFQLQATAQLPGSGISEMTMNAALALIEAAKPRDEVEGALAVQMAATHMATMAVLSKLGAAHGSERRVALLGSTASRLTRAYATQVEALRRLRNGGSQHVRVEHVHVNSGGQAIVGNVDRG